MPCRSAAPVGQPQGPPGRTLRPRPGWPKSVYTVVVTSGVRTAVQNSTRTFDWRAAQRRPRTSSPAGPSLQGQTRPARCARPRGHPSRRRLTERRRRSRIDGRDCGRTLVKVQAWRILSRRLADHARTSEARFGGAVRPGHVLRPGHGGTSQRSEAPSLPSSGEPARGLVDVVNRPVRTLLDDSAAPSPRSGKPFGVRCRCGAGRRLAEQGGHLSPHPPQSPRARHRFQDSPSTHRDVRCCELGTWMRCAFEEKESDEGHPLGSALAFDQALAPRLGFQEGPRWNVASR